MENMILTLLSLSNKKQALCNDDYKDKLKHLFKKKMNFVHVIDFKTKYIIYLLISSQTWVFDVK